MKALEIMKSNPVCANLEDTLNSIAQKMKSGDFGSIIIKEGDKPMGILTDRDMVTRGVAANNDLTQLKAKDVMTKNVVTCSVNDSIEDLCAKMKSEKIRRLVVLDDNNRLAGIISLGDIAIAEKGKETGPAFEALEKISEH